VRKHQPTAAWTPMATKIAWAPDHAVSCASRDLSIPLRRGPAVWRNQKTNVMFMDSAPSPSPACKAKRFCLLLAAACSVTRRLGGGIRITSRCLQLQTTFQRPQVCRNFQSLIVAAVISGDVAALKKCGVGPELHQSTPFSSTQTRKRALCRRSRVRADHSCDSRWTSRNPSVQFTKSPDPSVRVEGDTLPRRPGALGRSNLCCDHNGSTRSSIPRLTPKDSRSHLPVSKFPAHKKNSRRKKSNETPNEDESTRARQTANVYRRSTTTLDRRRRR